MCSANGVGRIRTSELKENSGLTVIKLFGLNKIFRNGTTIENENNENIVERMTNNTFNATLPQ